MKLTADWKAAASSSTVRSRCKAAYEERGKKKKRRKKLTKTAELPASAGDALTNRKKDEARRGKRKRNT
jgi:hypothetical protein